MAEFGASSKRRTPTSLERAYTRCAHCGRKMHDFAGGASRGFGGENLCHPNARNRPDCYQLVTVHGHELPCVSPVCFEDHPELLTYINGHPKTRRKPRAKKTKELINAH